MYSSHVYQKRRAWNYSKWKTEKLPKTRIDKKSRKLYIHIFLLYTRWHMLRHILMLSEVEMSVCECEYVFATVTWQTVIINRVERAHFILMSMEIGNQQPFLRLYTVLGVKSSIDLLYSLQLSLPFIRVCALCLSHLLQSVHLTLPTSHDATVDRDMYIHTHIFI